MPEAAQQIYDTCKENGWQVDYLINNAGFGGQGDFARERTMEHDRSTSGSSQIKEASAVCQCPQEPAFKDGRIEYEDNEYIRNGTASGPFSGPDIMSVFHIILLQIESYFCLQF